MPKRELDFCVVLPLRSSDPIADVDVPRFETVITLEQRASQGEPFRKLEGHYYQRKSWIPRRLFF